MTRLCCVLAALAAPCALGCELVDYVPLVPAASVDAPREPLAMTANGDHLWLSDTPLPFPPGQPLRLVLADADDGTVLSTFGPWTGEWAVVDIATEYELGSRDDIWILHVNGWRTRWSPDLTMTGYERPIPDEDYPVIWRSYCGVARDLLEGYTFVLTTEWSLAGYDSFLWRHHEGTWERAPAESVNCPELTFDLVANEVVTYDNVIDSVAWWDPSNLSIQHQVELPEKYYDLTAFDRSTALARYARIDHYDAAGDLIDTMPDVDPEGLHVHYGDGMLRLFFSGTDDLAAGPDAHAVGSWELQQPSP